MTESQRTVQYSRSIIGRFNTKGTDLTTSVFVFPSTTTLTPLYLITWLADRGQELDVRSYERYLWLGRMSVGEWLRFFNTEYVEVIFRGLLADEVRCLPRADFFCNGVCGNAVSLCSCLVLFCFVILQACRCAVRRASLFNALLFVCTIMTARSSSFL